MTSTPSANETRKTIEREIRKRHDIARVIETITLMLAAAVVCGTTYYLTMYSNNWDERGTALALTGAVVGVLTLWMISRRLLGASPIHTDDYYFKELVDKEIERIQTAIDDSNN